jgi:AcrR family transcriptional regulator
VAQRLTRAERQARTRVELLEVARRVFLRDGFHRASLEEISEKAGYTRGAVYSNFASKDDVFLALLDEAVTRRTREYAALALETPTFEKAVRAIARSFAQLDPEWRPLVIEFLLHAKRREPLRRALLAQQDRMLDAFAGVIEQLGKRYGVALRVTPRECARATRALGRGLTLERLLDPAAAPAGLVEDLFVTLTLGLCQPAKAHEGRPRRMR